MWRAHIFFVLLAAALGYGAVITAASGNPPYAWASFAGAAAAAALLALLSWSAWARTRAQVLLVGEPRGARLRALRHVLDGAGYAVATCPGPARRDCPVFEGKPCDVRADPVAALIHGTVAVGPWRAPCGRALGVPELAVEAREPGGFRGAASEGERLTGEFRTAVHELERLESLVAGAP